MRKISPATIKTIVARHCDVVYAYIAGYIEDHGYAPTITEIAERFNFSRTTADRVVGLIEEDGRITVFPKAWRGISLVSKIEKAAR